jgi:LacI family transcriptional regulator/LacI family repressor for deo operon, udp, cdd, tsx, nupC, and nupG
VARLAGVGVGTVSRVLNSSSFVSNDARSRVHQAIEELGYRRSESARSLSLGRSQAVGVVAPFFTAPSAVERLRGAVEHLAERGYEVVLFPVQSAEQRADAFRDFALHDRVDGLLVISLPLADGDVAALERHELRAVLIDACHPALAHVVVDDVLGGELAAQHLLAKGHRRIGFVGGAAGHAFGSASSERRLKGLRRTVARAGIERGNVIAQRGGYGRDEASALAAKLLSRDNPPTAVFAASDIQAFGVLEAASTLGMRVPDDVALIGFDDIEMAAVMGLTTVRQPLFESGAKGIDLLLAAIEGGDRRPVREVQPLTLVERRTT